MGASVEKKKLQSGRLHTKVSYGRLLREAEKALEGAGEEGGALPYAVSAPTLHCGNREMRVQRHVRHAEAPSSHWQHAIQGAQVVDSNPYR